MRISLTTRFSILKRDRFTCVYCGAHPPNVELEVDHYFPLARGGTDDYGNLVTACLECNRGKRDTPIDGDGWPEKDSPLMHWVLLGANEATSEIKDRILNRGENETLADAVGALWPEADY